MPSPFTRGAIAGRLLAEQLCGLDSALLEEMRTVPKAGLLPPQPLLGMIARHRISTIEANGQSEL